jgi:hypothetical protein
MGIQWMASWWVLVHCGPSSGVNQKQRNDLNIIKWVNYYGWPIKM